MISHLTHHHIADSIIMQFKYGYTVHIKVHDKVMNFIHRITYSLTSFKFILSKKIALILHFLIIL